MSLLSAGFAPILIAQLLAPTHPTRTPPRSDTTAARIDSAVVHVDTAPLARVAFDFGVGLGQPVAARNFEFGISRVPGPTLKNQMPATTQVRLVRAPDGLSAELARRVSSGERISVVDAQLQGGSGAPAVLLHLHDVQVVSTRLLMNDDNVGLVQQRLGLEESIAQIGVDLQEAQRQLSATESLEKRHLSSPLELARARASADVLAKRLAVQQRRLALVEQQLARWTPVQEEVVLAAARTELETH